MYNFRVKTLKREATNKNERKEGADVYKYFSERKSVLNYCYKYMMLYYEDIRTGQRVQLGTKTLYIIYEVRANGSAIRYKDASGCKHTEPTAHRFDLFYKAEADNLKSIAEAFEVDSSNLSAYIIDDVDSIEGADSIHLLKDKYIIYKTLEESEEIDDNYNDLQDEEITFI